jgi:LPXTG-motif cell wall-anchored protein
MVDVPIGQLRRERLMYDEDLGAGIIGGGSVAGALAFTGTNAYLFVIVGALLVLSGLLLYRWSGRTAAQ